MQKIFQNGSPWGVQGSDFVPLSHICPASAVSWRNFPGNPLLGLEPSVINQAILYNSTPEQPLVPMTMRQLGKIFEHLGASMPDFDVIQNSRQSRGDYTSAQRDAANILSASGSLRQWQTVEALSSNYTRSSLISNWRNRSLDEERELARKKKIEEELAAAAAVTSIPAPVLVPAPAPTAPLVEYVSPPPSIRPTPTPTPHYAHAA